MSRERMNGEDESGPKTGEGVILTQGEYKKNSPFADISPRVEQPLKILTPRPETPAINKEQYRQQELERARQKAFLDQTDELTETAELAAGKLGRAFIPRDFDPQKAILEQGLKRRPGKTGPYTEYYDPTTGEVKARIPIIGGGSDGGVEGRGSALRDEIRMEIAGLSPEAAYELLSFKVEGVLRTAEEQDSPFESGRAEAVNQLYVAIIQALPGMGAEYQAMSEFLVQEISARLKYRNAAYQAGNSGGETFSKELLSIYQEEHEQMIGGKLKKDLKAKKRRAEEITPEDIERDRIFPENSYLNRHHGVRDALFFQERDEGKFFRLKEAEDIAKLKVEYIEKAAPKMHFGAELSGIDKKMLEKALNLVELGMLSEGALIRAAVELNEETNKNPELTPEQKAAQMRAAPSVLAQRVFYELNRDWRIAKDMTHMFATAVDFDGPRSKKDGSLMQPTEVMLDVVNRKKEHIRINLANIQTLEEREALDDLRRNDAYFEIGMAWDRAWREFYRDHYDEINKVDSLTGRAPKRLGAQINYPIVLEKPGTPNKGKAAFLRKYAHANVASYKNTMGVRRTEEVIDEFHYGTYFNWGGRINGADKFRKQFTDEGVKVLTEGSSIVNTLKTLKEMKGVLSYLPEKEQKEWAAHFLEGMAEYQRHYLKKDFPQYKHNANTRDIDNLLRGAAATDIITTEQADISREKLLGDKFWVNLIAFFQTADSKHAAKEFFSKLFEGLFKALFSGK